MTPEDFLIGLAQDPPPDSPTDLMRLCLFDWAVCAIAGQDEPVSEILAMACDSEGVCSVVGGGHTTAAEAALINGTTGHALDYDDTHFGHIGHTSAVVMPALLALAEENEADMDALLQAAAIGSEAALRCGLWLGRGHYQIGFHQTATAGAIGATVGAAHLLGLDGGRTRHAIGLAATGASGLKGQFGTMGKPLNAGLAARVAVESAVWAQAGMTSDAAGLSGLQGLGATHHGAADETALTGPDWQISVISHKFHACCHGLHAMLEALQGIGGDVERFDVTTHPRWMSVCNQPDPQTGLEMKFSYRMTAAMVLSGVDTADIGAFSDSAAKDPGLIDLRDRVFVAEDAALTETQARVVVTRGDGRTETHFHDLADPMPLQTRETRLKRKARAVLGSARAETLFEATQMADLGHLAAALRA